MRYLAEIEVDIAFASPDDAAALDYVRRVVAQIEQEHAPRRLWYDVTRLEERDEQGQDQE